MAVCIKEQMVVSEAVAVEEAVFAAHLDWGYEDEEYNVSLEFSLVLEDGEWRYLEH